MKPPTKFETAYKELNRIGSGPMNDEAIAEIKKAMNGSVSLLVARAAQIAGKRELHDLIPDMLNAFDRFMVSGSRTDKGCSAKTAILDTLNKLEHPDDSAFRMGAYYEQMEPAFGGFVDAAIDARCQCAFGLARIGRPDGYTVLADLLVDKEQAVRMATAKALGGLASAESVIMLRMRVMTDESDLEVASECFTSIIAIEPDNSLDFVSRYLAPKNPMLAEYAALAIGSSHAPQAFEMLRKCWEDNLSPTLRRALLLPIAIIRSDEAFAFLLEVLSHSDTQTASQAISALGLYKDDTSTSKIREVVNKRGDRNIAVSFEGEFGRID